jgi:hypothetical protein
VIDLGQVQASIAALDALTVGQAVVLLHQAQAALGRANAIAVQVGISGAVNLYGAGDALPGQGARDALGQGIAAKLAVLEGSDAGGAVRGPALEAVKADALSALAELDAAVEGAQLEQGFRDQLYADVLANARNLPGDAYNAAAGAAKGILFGLELGALVALAVGAVLLYKFVEEG